MSYIYRQIEIDGQPWIARVASELAAADLGVNVPTSALDAWANDNIADITIVATRKVRAMSRSVPVITLEKKDVGKR